MAINRSAEVAIFCCSGRTFSNYTYGTTLAGILVLPIPNTSFLMGKFNSPLLWDVFAISIFVNFFGFWWTGLLPDFAMIRDRAIKPFQKKIYSILSFGWSGKKTGKDLKKVSCISWSGYTVSFVSAPSCLLICNFCDTWMTYNNISSLLWLEQYFLVLQWFKHY